MIERMIADFVPVRDGSLELPSVLCPLEIPCNHEQCQRQTQTRGKIADSVQGKVVNGVARRALSDAMNRRIAGNIIEIDRNRA